VPLHFDKPETHVAQAIPMTETNIEFDSVDHGADRPRLETNSGDWRRVRDTNVRISDWASHTALDLPNLTPKAQFTFRRHTPDLRIGRRASGQRDEMAGVLIRPIESGYCLIPPFQPDGLLPSGEHECTLFEIRSSLTFSPRRVKLFENMQRLVMWVPLRRAIDSRERVPQLDRSH
jgi:hypothetical protein